MERKTETSVSSSKNMLELKKHVAVIHSSNRLTLLQRKIANALLFNAYKELQEKDEHVIHISKLCEIIGYSSNDYKTIKTALLNLISTVLEWNLVDNDKLKSDGVWNASSIIAGATIEGAVCTYSYSSQMRKLLFRPNMYGRLDMKVQAQFQSTYGLALYENCNRFQDIGQTPWFTLLKFRKLMGVEDGKYKIFRDFKTRVLDKAVEEVNKYSPLEITTQVRKQNRQVVSIQFLIKSRGIKLPEVSNAVIEDLLKNTFNFSMKQVNETLQKYEEQYIKEKIILVRSSTSYKNNKVKNLTKYLLAALKEDYQDTKISETTVNHEKKNKMTHVSVTNVKNNHKADIEIQTQFKRFQENQLFKLFTQLSDQQQQSLMKKFEKYLVGMYQHLYAREGLKNILIQEQLCHFLRKSNHELVYSLLSFDDWLKNFT